MVIRRTTVTVRVPGSTSNLGAGFDCVGVAVDRWLRVTARLAPGAAGIERRGTLQTLDTPLAQDLVYRGFAAACDRARQEIPRDVAFLADSEIPVARGLGSSAAALVAGAVVARELLSLPLDRAAIATVCAELEGHPDNVAAMVYGGAMLAVSTPDGLVVSPLAVHPSLALVFAIPDFSIETKRARAVLPAALAYPQAVQAATRSAALVQGLAQGDPRLLAAGLDDVLHVPFRRSLVIGYDAVTSAARSAGAYGATLSGSGPTLVAVAPVGGSDAVATAMIRAWRECGIVAEPFHVVRPAGGYATD